jgi:hypothetical protein
VSPGAALKRLAGLGGLALAADLGLAWFAAAAGVPFALDSVGTAVAGAAGGPIVGLVVGLASGTLTSALVPGAAPHGAAMVAHSIVGLSAALAGRAGALRSTGRSVPAGAAAGLATAFAALAWPAGGVTPLAVLLRGGSGGASFVLGAVAVAAEVLDKAIAFALAGVLLRRLPPPFRPWEPGSPARRRGGRSASR